MARADLMAFRDNIETMIERGRALVSEGVSQDEFVDQLDVSDIGWDYSGGFAASSIPNLYDELSGGE